MIPGKSMCLFTVNAYFWSDSFRNDIASVNKSDQIRYEVMSSIWLLYSMSYGLSHC